MRRRVRAAHAALKLAIAMGVCACSAEAVPAAEVLREDFESGLGAWMINAGLPSGSAATTSAAPVPRGGSFVHKDGEITRIHRAFTLHPQADKARLTVDFYTNSPATPQRSAAQLSELTGGAPASSSGLARIGTNGNFTATTYQFTHMPQAAETVDTGVPLAAGWHRATLTYDLPGKKIVWSLDGTSGTVDNPALAAPMAVVLGQSAQNGGNGVPDTSTWWDNVLVEQFAPAALAATLVGPTNGATNVPVDQDLNWSSGGALADVYFGTSPGGMGRVGQGLAIETWDPGELLPGQAYFWRVDALNVLGDPTLGPVYSFITVPEPAFGVMLGMSAWLVSRGRRKPSSGA